MEISIKQMTFDQLFVIKNLANYISDVYVAQLGQKIEMLTFSSRIIDELEYRQNIFLKYMFAALYTIAVLEILIK